MSYTLACERPDLFRAIGSVTGNMSAYDQVNCNPETALPTIHLHGTLDPTVSYNQGVILDGPWSGGWGVGYISQCDDCGRRSLEPHRPIL